MLKSNNIIPLLKKMYIKHSCLPRISSLKIQNNLHLNCSYEKHIETKLKCVVLKQIIIFHWTYLHVTASRQKDSFFFIRRTFYTRDRTNVSVLNCEKTYNHNL